MPRAIVNYIRWVDAFNRGVGRLVMLLIFVMMGLLLYASISRGLFNSPLVWGIEASQFLMASYYLLGGAYSMQMDAHVRMDLFYSRWSDRTRAMVDVVTMLLLFVFLGALLMGGISSTSYALQYNETSYSTWGPPLAPIKILMTFGILMMLLQCLSTFFKDIARLRGEVIE